MGKDVQRKGSPLILGDGFLVEMKLVTSKLVKIILLLLRYYQF